MQQNLYFIAGWINFFQWPPPRPLLNSNGSWTITFCVNRNILSTFFIYKDSTDFDWGFFCHFLFALVRPIWCRHPLFLMLIQQFSWYAPHLLLYRVHDWIFMQYTTTIELHPIPVRCNLRTRSIIYDTHLFVG
jgi:hypothetical protein